MVVLVDFHRLNSSQHVEECLPDNSTEDGMFAVQPAGGVKGNEERALIRVLHVQIHASEQPSTCELETLVNFICERHRWTRDRRLRELHEQAFHNAVERQVIECILQRELHEVPTCERRNVWPELHIDLAKTTDKTDAAPGSWLVGVNARHPSDA